MRWLGWMVDVAREQAPSRAQLADWLERSAAAGFTALGLYLEHRFAYRVAPWARPAGALTPDDIHWLAGHARRLRIRLIPFLNTLGHMEGFLRADGGQWLAEELGTGSQQICPSRPECVAFVEGLVDEALAAFDDEWVHLGGDEARQLGACPTCRRRGIELRDALRADGVVDIDERAALYGMHVASLCRRVVAAGRRPCLWADMLLQQPAALRLLPRETILFDWQYEGSPAASSARLRDAGFDVICCPALHTYDAAYCFLQRSFENIDQHAQAADDVGALGVLLTTWEFAYFSNLASVLPLVEAAGLRLTRGLDWGAALFAAGGEPFARAAEILGREIPASSRFLAPGGWRRLRDALVIRQNPFLLWRFWRDEALGAIGDRILDDCRRCRTLLADDHPLNSAVELHEVSVQWVRAVELAAQRYTAGALDECQRRLHEAASILARLRPWLLAIAAGGGSSVDVERLNELIGFVGVVCQRVERLVDAAARESGAQRGWRPAFESITDRGYVAGDMAGWSCGSGLSRAVAGEPDAAQHRLSGAAGS